MNILKLGSSGKEVSDLQKYLDLIGYKIIADGVFGKITNLCVKDFQRHVGIKADGIVGKITYSKIQEYNQVRFCPEVYEKVSGIEEGSIEDIESTLKFNFKGLGKDFYELCKKYNYKWTHCEARGILESDHGRSKIARDKNNLFGFCAYDSSAYTSAHGYKTKRDSIEEFLKFVSREYLNPQGKYFNGDSEKGINTKYSTSPVAGINVSFLVRSIRQSIGLINVPDQITAHFNIKEFRCKNGTDVPPELYNNLLSWCIKGEELRSKACELAGKDVKVIILNGYRPKPYNEKILLEAMKKYPKEKWRWPAKNSYHIPALAGDVHLPGFTPRQVFNMAKGIFNGRGLYYTFVHLDVREKPTTWGLK